jgi:FG-GAP repeat
MASTAFADVNGDGYADAIVNNLRGDVTVRPSNGTTIFTGLTDRIPERLGGSHESD